MPLPTQKPIATPEKVDDTTLQGAITSQLFLVIDILDRYLIQTSAIRAVIAKETHKELRNDEMTKVEPCVALKEPSQDGCNTKDGLKHLLSVIRHVAHVERIVCHLVCRHRKVPIESLESRERNDSP